MEKDYEAGPSREGCSDQNYASYKEAECRKRQICDEVESAKKKIAKESQKIISMAVNKDAIIWDYKNKMMDCMKENERLKVEMNELRQDLEKVQAAYNASLTARSALRNKVEIVRDFAQVVSNNIKSTEEFVSQVKSDKKAISRAIEERRREWENHKARMADMKAEYTTTLEGLREKLSVSQEMNGELRGKIEALHKETSLTADTITDIRSQRDVLQDTNLTLNRDIKELVDKVGKLQEENLQVKSENTVKMLQLERDCSHFQSEVSNLKGTISEAHAYMESASEQIKILTEEKAALEGKLQVEKSHNDNEVKALTKEIIMMQEKCKELNHAVEDRELEMKQKEDVYNAQISTHQCKIDEMKGQYEEVMKDNEKLIHQSKELAEELKITKEDNQKMQREYDLQIKKNHQDFENMKIIFNEQNSTSDAKENELMVKIKSLNEDILLKAEEMKQVEKKYKEALEANKQNKDLEMKYASLSERYDIMQREMKLLKVEKMKQQTPQFPSMSPVVGGNGAGDKVRVGGDSQKPVWKIPTKNPRKDMQKRMDSDSDESASDAYCFDGDIIKKHVEIFSKLEEKGLTKKMNRRTTHKRS